MGRARGFQFGAVAVAAALLAACTSDDPSPDPTPTAAATLAPGEFAIGVPPGWEAAETTPEEGEREAMWVSPAQEDGTRLGLRIESGCFDDDFDSLTDQLQGPEGNWRGYTLLAGPEAVDVPGAAQAERWQAEYLLPAPEGEGDARLLSTEVFALTADGTGYHAAYEGRDAWYDQELANQMLGSLEVSGIGCG